MQGHIILPKYILVFLLMLISSALLCLIEEYE